MLFSTGYQANLGVIKAMVSRGDNIVSDELNHASLVDGSILSRASFNRYKHNDYNDLEKKISQYKTKNNRNIIIAIIIKKV